MISANPKDCVVRSQVQSVEFGFYRDQHVRDRSVVEVTSSVSFDPTLSPLPGGLYDPRMGPVAGGGGGGGSTEPPCPTCALRVQHCPGHFGHVELAVPVYHPLLFQHELLSALRIKCFACHKLRSPSRSLAIFRAKFHLLHQHKIAQVLQGLDAELQAAVVDARETSGETGGGRSGGGRQPSVNAAGRAMDVVLQRYQPPTTTTANRNNRVLLNSYERTLRKQLQKELLSDCKGSKQCPHCGAISPKIRQDSANKLFQAALSLKDRRLNRLEAGISEFPSALQSETKKRKQNSDSDDQAYDSDDTVTRPQDDEDDEEMEEADEESDESSDEDSDSGSGATPSSKAPKKADKFMHAAEVQAQLKRTWATEPYLLNCLFGSGGDASNETSHDKDGYQLYFLQAIPVPPNRFRPPMHLNGLVVEHSQTQYLSKVIQTNEVIRDHFAAGRESQAYASWIDLQTTVNCFMDASKDPSSTPTNQVAPGIRQILERKEGLFRKNMMGKRVDYACRSVISPDPFIGADEIGLPRYFATVLTYPTRVTDINIREMRQLVERGPHNYPGARWVEMREGGQRVDLSKMNRYKREAIAAQLLTHLKKKGGRPALVGRQLRDGDYVLMNRQPTLHKPGIMAHRVRVLHNPTQKTIRMHYANCNTYNADYDGDEMNCHFPQDDISRAEAKYIAHTDLQYIVPTDGSPLRGLIQDHVIGGVKLTNKDTFLEKWEYQQLVFACMSTLPGLEVIRSDMDILQVPPAIIKPRELWTGKQVITTLLLHLGRGNDRDSPEMSGFPGISTERKSKTPETAFGPEQEEHLVLVRDGELLRGVLDKAAFGATDFSLVHAVYEAYGPEKAGALLNALSRLFTAYIQYYAGHSCRTEDLMLTKEADDQRRNLVRRAYNLGTRAAKAWAESEGGKVPIAPVDELEGAEQPLKPVEKASASAKIGELLSGNEGKDNFAAFDSFMQGQLNPLASDIVKKSLPSGLVVPFPFNSFGLMTTTGAKGSIVNQSQVVCALGQQALEGRRVPRLSSGRSLPSFAPYDPNPRADGFVMDRFLTGIRPQEYYFHCMAGREGLVDTAVKTSRSGYLQRCLMKHLEELKICYDFTVRNAEGGVVQFLYGEDALDPTKAAFLDCSDRSFEFLVRNYRSLRRQNAALPMCTIDVAAADSLRNKAVSSGTGELLAPGARVEARKLREGNVWKRGMLCRGWFEAIIKKTHKDGTVDLEYLDDGRVAKRVPAQVDLGRSDSTRTEVASSIVTLVRPTAFDPVLSSKRQGFRLGSSGACLSERVASSAYNAALNKRLQTIMERSNVSAGEFGELIATKYGSSLCSPGEAVGSIAAQSIGEPSTQMTLNTFHLAGSGANVTLGIPRLREIIMTASRDLKTPTMSVPLHDHVTEKQAIRLARKFTKLTLMELISGNRGVTVTERLEKEDSGRWSRAYYIKLKLHPAERIREAFGLSLREIARVVGKNFVPRLAQSMKRELRRSAAEGDIGSFDVHGGASSEYFDTDADKADDDKGSVRDELNDEEGAVDDDGDELGEEDGADAAKYRRRSQSVSYEDDSDGEAQDNTDADRPSSTEDLNESEEEGEGEEEEDQKPSLNTGEDRLSINEKANTITLESLRVDPSVRPLLMVGLVERAAAATIVRAKKNIDQAFINEEAGRGLCLQTAGINFEEIWKLDNVDHGRLMSNDIWAIRCAYGVEAGRSSIVEQIRSVFGAYGIEVDPRHLSLIADYMTYDGGFKPMNRIGMEQTSSTFLQMSFETTVHFLRQAALSGENDTLASPSANLVMGRPIRHGTGSFAVLAK